MKTISVRELSEELGISKQAIHKRMEQLPSQFQPELVDGVYELTPRIADAIRLSKKGAIDVNQPKVTRVDALEVQISELKEEKKRLYSQLEQFKKILDQQQQLTLQSNQQIRQLQLEATKQTEGKPNQKEPESVQADDTESSPAPTKQSLFSRLFRI